jgi:CubicO group peptidase (beta-lactamase class C family)
VAAGRALGRWVLALAGAVALLPAAEATARADAAPAADTEAGRAQLLARVEELVRAGGLAGAAFALVTRDGIWARAVGQASREPAAPMTTDTLFRVGSLSKSFIAVAVMRLVEQGRLRLTDRVRDLVPEVALDNPWEDTHPLAVAHLLEHTGGFDEMRFNEIIAPDQREDRPLTEVLAVNPRSRQVRWPPGTRWSYSQPGYTVAAAIIEKVTGVPYERFLADEVFRPLGIAGAALRMDASVRPRLATGYRRRRPVTYVNLLHRPAGNLMISAADLARLVAMLVGRGEIEGRRVLGADSVARIERSGTLPYGPAEVRYGLGNWGDVGTRVPTRGHGGWVPGYQSMYRYVPALGVGFVVLVNDNAGDRAHGPLKQLLLDHLLAGQRPAPPPEAPMPGPALARYLGHYQLASPAIEFLRFHSDLYAGVTVRARDGGLVLAWTDGPEQRLVASGPDQFRFPRQSGSSVQFVRAQDGRRVMVIGQGYFQEASAAWSWLRRSALELAVWLLSTTALAPLVFVALLGAGGLAGPLDRAQAGLLLRPFAAALCLWLAHQCFDSAGRNGELGTCTRMTVLVWLLSWGFAFAARGALLAALRAGRAPRPGAGLVRAYALCTGGAATLIALYMAHYGLIGVRTWRW